MSWTFKPVEVMLTWSVSPAGALALSSRATSPTVCALLRSTMLWCPLPSVMAMLPRLTPSPPLRSESLVSAVKAGLRSAPSTGAEMAPKASAPVTLVTNGRLRSEKLVRFWSLPLYWMSPLAVVVNGVTVVFDPAKRYRPSNCWLPRFINSWMIWLICWAAAVR